MENEESQIKSDKAQKLAKYFGVSVGYLLGYEPESEQVSNYQKIKICFSNGEELKKNEEVEYEDKNINRDDHFSL